MAYHPRRVPVPSIQQYSAVPQSPASRSTRTPLRPPPKPQPYANQGQSARGAVVQGVATGSIGAGYGPYTLHPPQPPRPPPPPPRDHGNSRHLSSHLSAAHSDMTTMTEKNLPPTAPNTSSVPAYLWDSREPDLDDALHNPDPLRDAALDRSFTIFSARGWINSFALVSLTFGIITLFIGYPIIAWSRRVTLQAVGYNLGGINGTGQVPYLPNMPQLIDPDTPTSARTRVGSDGQTYNLVFSDEFNIDGRTFWPGDDAWWEAVDLQYWPTGDLEWYNPQAITTRNGKLVITLSESENHNLNFQSGMLTSWNKICFTTGYIEVSVSLPGAPTTPGLWPAVWTMGNLGRAGFGSTTEGMWPYSYDTCDLGTFPNQTSQTGQPAAATTGAPGGGPLSYLPGQRLSACTCPGSDHPGPNTNTGRGVPEVDVFEAQVDVALGQGQVSQSLQIAPYDYQYNFNDVAPATTIYNDTATTLNTYVGGVFQQALSAVTFVDSANYNGQSYAPYGFELWSNPENRPEGYVTWYSDGVPTWTVTSASMGPDTISEVQQRLISEEPMYIIMNLGISPSFQKPNFAQLTFPSVMYVDYVRVYQRESVKGGLTCNPSAYPTAQYIANHPSAYANPNLTTWAQAGYTFPRNSEYDGC